MEYEEIQSEGGKSIYVSLEREMVRTDFDTGVTKTELHYHDSVPTGMNDLYEVKVELSREFIDDTYHFRGTLTDEAKIKACLDVGMRAYKERGGDLRDIETIQGVKANERLHYIPRVDMKPPLS